MSDFDRIARLATALPETELPHSWGTRSVKAKGTMILRQYEDPDLIALKVEPDERSALMAERPSTFTITPHFENYKYMLVRTADLNDDELGELITDAWRSTVPKRVSRTYDESGTAGRHKDKDGKTGGSKRSDS